jgi:RHS repeat-associated protein
MHAATAMTYPRITAAIKTARAIVAGYYDQDGLGSVTSLSSSTAAVVNSYTYDSFGNIAASTNGLTNPLQYTGRDTDSETGLRYYRSRYYDPQVGRFLSQDSSHFDGGINFYVYVSNDPISWTDAYGLKKQCKSCGIKSFSGYTTRAGQPIRGTAQAGASFYWHAEFLNDATHDPACCEIRQYFSFQNGPPQNASAFPHPEQLKAGTWYEDRSDMGQRYGRRTGPYSYGHFAPGKDTGVLDWFEGNEYWGEDTPRIHHRDVYRLRLEVVDVCRGIPILGSMPIKIEF